MTDISKDERAGLERPAAGEAREDRQVPGSQPDAKGGGSEVSGSGTARRAALGVDIAEKLGRGSDAALAEVNRLAAEHFMFAAVDCAGAGYYTIRDSEADDGRYKWRDDIAPCESLTELRDAAMHQLPLAVEALQHAVKAVALEPDSKDSMFRLERTLEEVVDAAGTLMVVREEIVRRRQNDETAEEPADA